MGVPFPQVDASITITLSTYSHVLPDIQDTAADAMEAALGAIP